MEQNKNNKAPRASLWRVVRAHWAGVRGMEIQFYSALILGIVAALATVATPVYFKWLLDGFQAGATRAELLNILYGLTAVGVLGWAARRVEFYALNHVEAYGMSALANISVRSLLYHSHTFFQNSFAGAIVQKVRRFSSSFERLVDLLILSFIPISITLGGAIVVVWFDEPTLAYVMLGWVCTFLVLNYAFSQFKLPYDLKRASLDSEMTASVADVISNHAAVSAHAAEKRELEFVASVAERRAKAMWDSWFMSLIFDGVQSFLMIIVTFAVLYIAIDQWFAGTITLGSLALVQLYVLRMSDTMWELGRLLRSLYEVVADSSEMMAILDAPHEIVDTPGAVKVPVKNGDVAFESVSFKYPSGKSILSSLSLNIPAGQKVALVGPSGSGKTTIAKLLTRLYDVSGGEITLDGTPITGMTQESLRLSIASVPQDPALFHRTILDNIRYGNPDATDDQVKHAARLAHCDEFISHLPLGYQTLVGERGVKLSGGERQRVAIARAILKNAPILILDEATSALDSHSEALIQDALDTLMRGKTVIVIAHRLSTIRKMDRILVMRGGAIVEDGTHDELLRDEQSLYKQLWDMQAGGFVADDGQDVDENVA